MKEKFIGLNTIILIKVLVTIVILEAAIIEVRIMGGQN
jgi:hypothetical protein